MAFLLVFLRHHPKEKVPSEQHLFVPVLLPPGHGLSLDVLWWTSFTWGHISTCRFGGWSRSICSRFDMLACLRICQPLRLWKMGPLLQYAQDGDNNANLVASSKTCPFGCFWGQVWYASNKDPAFFWGKGADIVAHRSKDNPHRMWPPRTP